jgi:hypothetical protein
MLVVMREVTGNSRKVKRAPRIRVPGNEKALFIADDQKFLGVIQRLSLSGGSAILPKGPVREGTLARMGLNTVFGKVTAQVQFLRTGAEGMALAQAFRFVEMDDMSAKRFASAAAQMQKAGFSDAGEAGNSLGVVVSETLSKLCDSFQRLSGVMGPSRKAKPSS